MDKRCKIAIFMGLTDPEGPHHKRQSMVLVPLDTPGVKCFRMRHLRDLTPPARAKTALLVTAISIVTPFIRAGTLKPLGVTTIGGRS